MRIGLREPKCGSFESRIKNSGLAITLCGAMDGDGPFSKPMHPISKWQPTTKRTARAATFRQSRPTGSTSEAIRFSLQDEGHRDGKSAPRDERRRNHESTFIGNTRWTHVYRCYPWPGR